MEKYTESTISFKDHTIHIITFASAFEENPTAIKQEQNLRELQEKFFTDHPEEDKKLHVFSVLTPTATLPLTVESDGSVTYHLTKQMLSDGASESTQESYTHAIKDRLSEEIDESVFRVL